MDRELVRAKFDQLNHAPAGPLPVVYRAPVPRREAGRWESPEYFLPTGGTIDMNDGAQRGSKERPRRLFKYRAINPYTEAIFRDKTLRWTAPVELNDPFESRIDITYGDVGPNDVAAIERRVLEMDPRLSQADAHSFAASIAADPASRGAHLGLGVVNQIRSHSAALSLTEVPDDVLMWSHYADSHRGICIEFSIERCATLHQVLPVRYSSKVPRFEFFLASIEEIAFAAMLTKSDHWSYEREWRLVEVGKSSCNVPFDPAALTGVIFGCNCPAEHRGRVRAWLEVWPSPVQLFQARLTKGEYGVQVADRVS